MKERQLEIRLLPKITAEALHLTTVLSFADLDIVHSTTIYTALLL